MNELIDFLKYVPIFAELDNDTIDKISKLGKRKHFHKETVILTEHETGSALFVIIKGKVKVSRESEDGREVILTILTDSDFFGEMAILDGLNRSANVTATEETELFIINRSDFLDLLYNHPEVSITLLQELTKRLRAADMKIKSLSLKDAEGKVATVILQLADDIGKIKQGVVEIEKLPYQHDLANMAGTSRETISRTLHSFAKKGYIELDGNKLRILNYEKFKELFKWTMNGKIDLHIHTNYSDGSFMPRKIIEKVHEKKIEIISITDHDTVSAIEETTFYGKQYGIEVIPGVELSSDVAGSEVHILGYFIDTENKELIRYLKFFRDERLNRAERIIKRLNNLGISIKLNDILKYSKEGAIGRPHIANALADKGYVKNYQEAFNKYLGNNAVAYEKKVHVSPSSTVKIINDAGGLSFIAHPAGMKDNIIKELIDSGIDGIEIIHPSHSSPRIKHFKGIANEYFLLCSGGSDFHGGKRNDEENLGNYSANIEWIEAMKNRLSPKAA